MVLRSAQEERAVRPYCAPSDGWPSNAIRRACGAIERTSVFACGGGAVNAHLILCTLISHHFSYNYTNTIHLPPVHHTRAVQAPQDIL